MTNDDFLGSEKQVLPAAAVVGAATAFGLATLLPLNVPQGKPLLYCNNTELAQTQIKLNETVYFCNNQSIAMSCPRTSDNGTVDECLNKTMECDVTDSKSAGGVYCTNDGTLKSTESIVCDSTTILNGTNVNETSTILNCYYGLLPETMASFIPTQTTEAPVTTTTEKSLSFGAHVHVFLLKLIGKSEALEKQTTTASPIEEDPRLLAAAERNETVWIPEAITIPPETNATTTTEAPFNFGVPLPRQLANGTFVNDTIILPDSLKDLFNQNDSMGIAIPDMVVKIPITTVSSADETTEGN